MFSLNKQKQARNQGQQPYWHLGIFPEADNFHISDIFHHLWPRHMRGEEFQVFGIDDNPSRKEFRGPELNAFKISSESKIEGIYDHLTRTT